MKLPTRRILLVACLALAGVPAWALPLAELMTPEPKPQSAVYKTVGTTEIRLWYYPAANAKPGEARPAVVLIHGGAWIGGDATAFFPHARYFASRGAVGFSLDYRLLTPEHGTVADCLSDCKSALRYIRSHARELGVDPQRIAVLGDSAGGHLAAALGTVEGFDDLQDDLKINAKADAMIPCNPIVDLTEDPWIRFIIRGKALEKNAPPEARLPNKEQLALARQLSPLFSVRAGTPPTLLMHGLNDTVVKPEQARRFAAAMQASGNRCDLALLPDAQHAFIVARYTAPEPMVVDAIRRADQFLVSLGYLTGEPTLEVSAHPAWISKGQKPQPAK